MGLTDNERIAIKWCYNVAMVFANEETKDIILEGNTGEFSLKETISGLLGGSDENE